ncbi:sortase B protein-sorting domain-containing protein [uncultured Clostridium sp.]
MNPQTGDVASVGLLQSIIVGSTSILALLLGNRKKRKR